MVQSKTRWPVSVRMSDLGPDETVRPARYLEWCQDAATWASNAGGYSSARYRQMGAAWYIREIMLHIEGTVSFGDQVTVETWVSSIRRFRSRREYTVSVGNKTCARAQADWLFVKVDGTTGKVRPYHLDDEMQAAFPIVDETAIAPTDMLTLGGTVTSTHTMDRPAMPSDIDRYGHVNHVHYVSWIEDHLTISGVAPTFKRLRLQYQADLKVHDLAHLHLEPGAEGALHEIRRNGERVARAISAW